MIIDELIQRIQNRHPSMSAIDVIVEYCESNEKEIESIANVIKKNPVLLQYVTADAEELSYIPKSSKLPL